MLPFLNSLPKYKSTVIYVGIGSAGHRYEIKNGIKYLPSKNNQQNPPFLRKLDRNFCAQTNTYIFLIDPQMEDHVEDENGNISEMPRGFAKYCRYDDECDEYKDMYEYNGRNKYEKIHLDDNTIQYKFTELDLTVISCRKYIDITDDFFTKLNNLSSRFNWLTFVIDYTKMPSEYRYIYKLGIHGSHIIYGFNVDETNYDPRSHDMTDSQCDFIVECEYNDESFNDCYGQYEECSFTVFNPYHLNFNEIIKYLNEYEPDFDRYGGDPDPDLENHPDLTEHIIIGLNNKRKNILCMITEMCELNKTNTYKFEKIKKEISKQLYDYIKWTNNFEDLDESKKEFVDLGSDIILSIQNIDNTDLLSKVEKFMPIYCIDGQYSCTETDEFGYNLSNNYTRENLPLT